MTWMISSEVEWLKEHAEIELRGGKKVQVCKETRALISTCFVGRSIWTKPFFGGSGEVRQVLHINCSGCNPDADAPCYGEPIYEDQLIDVDVRVD